MQLFRIPFKPLFRQILPVLIKHHIYPVNTASSIERLPRLTYSIPFTELAICLYCFLKCVPKYPFPCFPQASISLRIPKIISPVRGGHIGRSRAFIVFPPCVAVFKRICAVKNKGRTDKTLRVFLQRKNKVYLFARSLKVRGFVLFSPPALGFLCGLSQYGFCQF